MKTGFMRGLRSRPGGTALLVLLSVLLPLALGLLPPLAPTPAFALEQALASSRCDPLGSGAKQTAPAGHQSCCVMGHCCAAPPAVAPGFAFAPRPVARAATVVASPAAFRRPPVWRSAVQARAPPSA